MDNYDGDFDRIYAEVDRLSQILYTSGYHGWWFCSTTCAREQRDMLKEEMAACMTKEQYLQRLDQLKERHNPNSSQIQFGPHPFTEYPDHDVWDNSQHATGNNDHENRPISHLDITREAGYYWKLRQPTETVDGSHARQLAIARAEHAWRMTHITRGELEDAYRRLKFDTFRQQAATNNMTEDTDEYAGLEDADEFAQLKQFKILVDLVVAADTPEEARDKLDLSGLNMSYFMQPISIEDVPPEHYPEGLREKLVGKTQWDITLEAIVDAATPDEAVADTFCMPEDWPNHPDNIGLSATWAEALNKFDPEWHVLVFDEDDNEVLELGGE